MVPKKISEVVEILEELKRECGDLTVYTTDLRGKTKNAARVVDPRMGAIQSSSSDGYARFWEEGMCKCVLGPRVVRL